MKLMVPALLERAVALPSDKTPAARFVSPVRVFAPVNVSVLEPALVTPPAPLIIPAKV